MLLSYLESHWMYKTQHYIMYAHLVLCLYVIAYEPDYRNFVWIRMLCTCTYYWSVVIVLKRFTYPPQCYQCYCTSNKWIHLLLLQYHWEYLFVHSTYIFKLSYYKLLLIKNDYKFIVLLNFFLYYQFSNFCYTCNWVQRMLKSAPKIPLNVS